jgi:hypothetical protein
MAAGSWAATGRSCHDTGGSCILQLAIRIWIDVASHTFGQQLLEDDNGYGGEAV